MHSKIEISTGTIVKAVLVGILLALLWFLRDLVLVVLTSVVVASAVEPFARWFVQRRVPRTIAVILIYLAVFLIFASAIYFIVPPLARDLTQAASQLPETLESINFFKRFTDFGSQITGQLGLSDFLSQIKNLITGASGGILSAASNIFGGVLSFVLIIVISFYLAVQERGIEKFLRIVVPSSHEEYVLDLWRRASHKIGLWMQGQILLGVFIGVLVFLGLSLLRVEYALAFAVLAMMFEIVPYVGPILSAVPPIAVGLTQSPITGLMVLGLFVIIQQFENQLIYPLVVRKIVGVHPIIVILALIIGAKLAGFLGIILAIPVAAALMEIVDDIDRKKHATG